MSLRVVTNYYWSLFDSSGVIGKSIGNIRVSGSLGEGGIGGVSGILGIAGRSR